MIQVGFPAGLEDQKVDQRRANKAAFGVRLSKALRGNAGWPLSFYLRKDLRRVDFQNYQSFCDIIITR